VARLLTTTAAVINWIEAPIPRTPISLAIFLHRGGASRDRVRSVQEAVREEYHAWAWAIRKMRELGVEPDARVERRVQLSMQYAVDKAVRRGIKQLPEQLEQFLPQAA
jgi:hypothetical protein